MKILLDFSDDSEVGSCNCGELQGPHHHLLLSPAWAWLESTELRRQGRITRTLAGYFAANGFYVTSKPSLLERRESGDDSVAVSKSAA